MKNLLAYLLLGLLCLCPPVLLGQRNEVSLAGLGNFNPVYWVGLHHGAFPIVGVNQSFLEKGSSKSTAGGALEYRYYWNDRNALGVLAEVNPSSIDLYAPNTTGFMPALQPDIRYDFDVLETQTFNATGRIRPFMQEGVGAALTDGYTQAGWSAEFAIVLGSGVDFQLTKHFSLRLADTFLTQKNGCYDDPTCQGSWGVVQNVRAGFTFKF